MNHKNRQNKTSDKHLKKNIVFFFFFTQKVNSVTIPPIQEGEKLTFFFFLHKV